MLLEIWNYKLYNCCEIDYLLLFTKYIITKTTKQQWMRDIPANIDEIAFPDQNQWFLPYVSRNTKSYTRSGFLNIYDSPESQETFIVLLTRSGLHCKSYKSFSSRQRLLNSFHYLQSSQLTMKISFILTRKDRMWFLHDKQAHNLQQLKKVALGF